MKCTMLGTGNALVTKYYNTCFTLSDGDRVLLVDGGGGNGLLTQLERADVDWRNIHEIFVTHKHIDHIMGVVWILRMILQGISSGRYEGDAVLYAHDEVIGLLQRMVTELIPKKHTKHLGERVFLMEVRDRETAPLLGRKAIFFDIGSTKAKQFGFTMRLQNGERFTCCGDEPYNSNARAIVEGSEWMMHEAFCLEAHADRFKPYEKNHSTAKDACRTAQELGVKNLILYHTEEATYPNRKALYAQEGREVFSGKLWIPDDLETIEIDEGIATKQEESQL